MHKSGSRSKWFIDITARHFWVHSDIERRNRTDAYNVKRNFMAFSAEIGKLYYGRAPEWLNFGNKKRGWASHMSFEPKVEVRYKQGAAQDFTTEAGNRGYVDITKSFSTHLNLQTNFLPNGVRSKWKPYLELGVYNEWMGETQVKFAELDLIPSDTRGLGFNITVGTNVELSRKAYAYGGITAEVGNVYTSYQLNLGLRTKF
jgi:outer membrane autotransporter protein